MDQRIGKRFEGASVTVTQSVIRVVNIFFRSRGYHQAIGQTVMPCRPQRRQRHIWPYQPVPSLSKPSCGVSPPQSPQKWWNRSSWLPKRISPRQARFEAVNQSSNATNVCCQRGRRVPLRRPRPCSVGAAPTRPRRPRSVKGRM